MSSPSIPLQLTPLTKISTVGTWNSLIREALNRNNPRKSLFLFRQMKQNGVEPNNLTFPFVAKACAKLSNLNYSQIIHTHIVKSPIWSDIFVQTATIDMYWKCDRFDYAYDLFEKMPERDVASWNAILVGIAQLHFPFRFSCLFREMRFGGIKPDSITVMALTHSVLHTKNLELMKSVHSFGFRIGTDADVSVANTWISAYGKCGDLVSAKMVFDEIDTELRTVISWNCLIAAYANCEKVNAFRFYQLMLHDGFKPDISTILSLLSSCVQPVTLFRGRSVHAHAIQLGSDLDVAVLNTLISMYSKCRDTDSARFIFDGMSVRTCVSWTAMISGYAEKGDLDEAMDLFRAMEAAGEKPDLVTVLSLVSGCGLSGSLEHGRWIEGYARSNGFKDSVILSNALIDMYAKCGNIYDARDLFNAMPERTIVSWTTMIAGYALNGYVMEALNLFSVMIDLGLKPNHITFLAVLQACSHAGFLEQGWECFNVMKKYNVSPGLDHYSCMVDLLARRGKLKEALELVKNMVVIPDAAIWGALLSACKIYRNVEIGEYVARHLLELEPQVAAPYVEMANIYASAGRWDGVAKIRSMMKHNMVRKNPGQSLIQINAKNCAFTVEDRDHPEGVLIYAVLDGLSLLSKDTLVEHLNYQTVS